MLAITCLGQGSSRGASTRRSSPSPTARTGDAGFMPVRSCRGSWTRGRRPWPSPPWLDHWWRCPCTLHPAAGARTAYSMPPHGPGGSPHEVVTERLPRTVAGCLGRYSAQPQPSGGSWARRQGAIMDTTMPARTTTPTTISGTCTTASRRGTARRRSSTTPSSAPARGVRWVMRLATGRVLDVASGTGENFPSAWPAPRGPASRPRRADFPGESVSGFVVHVHLTIHKR
jgi:hypothetical protein